MNNISPDGICLAVVSKLYWNISSLDSNCTLCWQKMEHVCRGLRMSSYNNAISSLLNLRAASVSRESCWINLLFSIIGHGVLVRRARRCAIFQFRPIASLPFCNLNLLSPYNNSTLQMKSYLKNIKYTLFCYWRHIFTLETMVVRLKFPQLRNLVSSVRRAPRSAAGHRAKLAICVLERITDEHMTHRETSNLVVSEAIHTLIAYY